VRPRPPERTARRCLSLLPDREPVRAGFEVLVVDDDGRVTMRQAARHRMAEAR
jgi:hypothetical protein